MIWWRALGVLLLWTSAASAQSPAEKAAAKETYVQGLRFEPSRGVLAEAGIRVAYVPTDTNPGGGRYSCSALDASVRAQAARALEQAFAKLGEVDLRKSGLKYILLCERATDSGRGIGGIPIPPIGMLMLATGQHRKVGERFSVTALHEFYHFMEYKRGKQNDSEWNQRFTGYSNSYGETFPSGEIGSGASGFITAYAQTFAHEDRAELFSLLHMKTDAVLAALRQSKGPVLAQKIEAIVARCRVMLGQSACR